MFEKHNHYPFLRNRQFLCPLIRGNILSHKIGKLVRVIALNSCLHNTGVATLSSIDWSGGQKSGTKYPMAENLGEFWKSLKRVFLNEHNVTHCARYIEKSVGTQSYTKLANRAVEKIKTMT